MPQPAERVDASMEIYSNEIRLDVDLLNIDSSSMRQIACSVGGDTAKVADRIREIVSLRGKMHNPVTGSGGCLVGRIAEIGPDAAPGTPPPGTRICPIVSLSLIPLQLDEIQHVDIRRCQVSVVGKAILFPTATYGVVPDDFDLTTAIAVIDVCGAPARLLRMAQPAQSVAILGAGKAGLLSLVAAREAVGPSGKVVMFDVNSENLNAARKLDIADALVLQDLTKPIESWQEAQQVTDDDLFDVVVNVTNVPNTEGAAILATRSGGRVLLFGMSTNFQACALSAEGAGKDIEMIIGNGYVAGCIDIGFDIVRRTPALRSVLEHMYHAA